MATKKLATTKEAEAKEVKKETTAKETKSETVKEVKKETKKSTEPNDIEVLKAQVEMLTQLLANGGANKVATVDEDRIGSDDLIPVISQTVGSLTLTTEGNGNGAIYDFSEFGEIQDINFRDLRDIVRNNKNMVTNGRFYILNEKAVKELRLESAYNKMLSNEEIATIFDKDVKSVVELYKLAPTGQKETIIDLVIDRKLNGQPIDANVLIQLGELCGKDLINMEA